MGREAEVGCRYDSDRELFGQSHCEMCDESPFVKIASSPEVQLGNESTKTPKKSSKLECQPRTSSDPVVLESWVERQAAGNMQRTEGKERVACMERSDRTEAIRAG